MSSGVRGHVLVLAKAPRPGRVKTRLCTRYTPAQAATVAAAALSDTLAAVARSRAARRILALDGNTGPWTPRGFDVIAQSSGGLDERLEAAWAATWRGSAAAPRDAVLQIGMDTPQITPELVDRSLATLEAPGTDAVIGLARDGGWWAIGFSRPRPGAFRGVPMSSPRTGGEQLVRLHELGLRVRFLPTLRDLDTPADADAIAAEAAGTRTAAVLRGLNRNGSA